jgi:hypothetical protein
MRSTPTNNCKARRRPARPDRADPAMLTLTPATRPLRRACC